MEILSVRVDNLSEKEILRKIQSFLCKNSFHQITTVNPEFILEAKKNSDFHEVLNNSDLNIADGIGIQFAFLRQGKKLKARFPGADLICEILKIAEEKNIPVFLAVNKKGLSSFQEIKKVLSKRHPKLKISGANLDPAPSNQQLTFNQEQVLICNFGAPNQELFINSVKNDRIRLAIGVGGSFDYLTKKIRRAPVFLQKIGLEWFWRLIQEPRYRCRRIFKAVIIFPVLVLFNKK